MRSVMKSHVIVRGYAVIMTCDRRATPRVLQSGMKLNEARTIANKWNEREKRDLAEAVAEAAAKRPDLSARNSLSDLTLATATPSTNRRVDGRSGSLRPVAQLAIMPVATTSPNATRRPCHCPPTECAMPATNGCH